MNDSLPLNENIFESVKINNILILISVLVDTDLWMKSIIRQRFNQEATYFNNTLTFLHKLGVVEETDNEIMLKDDFKKLVKDSDKGTISKQILDLVQKTNNPYQYEILKYLSKFRHIGGKIEYKPSDLRRGDFSDVRNFLIETGVVKYDHELDKYNILPEHIHLFALAIEKSSSYSPTKLKRKLIQKDEIGYAAELAVLKYEKGRVGPDYEKLVEHISLKNEAAGYDIKSVTIVGKTEEPRYIEVKAVSPDTYRFYWSQNEIRVSKLLKKTYYLYLLPVKSRMKFINDKIIIISDPIQQIFDKSDTWNVEPDVVSCSLNSLNKI